MVAPQSNAANSQFMARLAMIFVAIVGLFWTWISRPQDTTSQRSASARIGAIAPDFALLGLDGKSIALKDLRGKAVILNFWATWCPPCRAEMAALNQVQQDQADRGLVVLGVNQLESPQTVQRFMREQGLSFPIALDSVASTSEAYRVSALPTTYFIDRNGVIQDVVFGGPMAQALIESKALVLLNP